MKDKISGIFLLFSLVLSNYIDSTLGKRVNKIIQNNYAAKLAIVYILIYFTINFTSSDNNHIIEHFQNTTMIFILYILFTKINLYISLFLFGLFILNFIINKHIEYLEKLKKNTQDYEIYSNNNTKIIIIITISAFIYEIYDKDNLVKYIFTEN
jgi:hypothetical protein